MNTESILLGGTPIRHHATEPEGQFVQIEHEKYYKISNVDGMPDFFMTIVSDSDHWMFISSNGSLSAGRINRDNALFPYYTVDKIHDYKGTTGSKTILLAVLNGRVYLWEPFTAESGKVYSVKRNLYKSIYGNKIIFEEVNADLGILFQYGWYSSEKYGFIKKSTIRNLNAEHVYINVLDGIRNILPGGVEYDFQNTYSSLLDAYKKAELIRDSRLGLYMLSSIPVDKAEPSESLTATTVWMAGCNHDARILISDRQLERFRNGLNVKDEADARATRGSYFLNMRLELSGLEHKEWMVVADINQDSRDVANLDLEIRTATDIENRVNNDIGRGTENLKRIVAMADGMQISDDELCCARHFSNTLFNVMRGGVFIHNYILKTIDFRQFLHRWNRDLFRKFNSWLEKLPAEISYPDLIRLAGETSDRDISRICYEYLPLTFSRRHGDPSRPWNQFSIETKNDDGSVRLNYQGNWRDIFQNWEALSLSFPEFLESMISKFVNATTVDGYNPYRITREGIDWECPDPLDPWAYIGYWGDHQVIYLQKFLELSVDFHPGKLDELLQKEVFVYANVPYRIKPYFEIVGNPKDTIVFDSGLNDTIKERVEQLGADGRLVTGPDRGIYKVNLTEKILVSYLAKLCNFIPEAGIWLNTQRPEWNDANNALVGNGVSMVTLYYLRRSLNFWHEQFERSSLKEIAVSDEVAGLFQAVFSILARNEALVGTGFSDADRRLIADALGNAASEYRNTVYHHSFSGTRTMITVKRLSEFAELSLRYIDQSIRVNKRDDGLYHAYNLISFTGNGISIRHLYEMLEGQVAVLSSGYLSVEENLDVLDALKRSKLFRRDQNSYVLYPDRQLPRFMEKNNIPVHRVRESKLLGRLIADRDTSVIITDNAGKYHFNGKFRNAGILEKALGKLDHETYSSLVEKEKEMILKIYEEIFDHQSFTGRSGTFYGYEGLGSIYWHMVSKLLLAAQECYFRGVSEAEDHAVPGKIKDHYFEIKAGIGFYKSPGLYGAFPTDPYSHTPGNAGAQQPGMTGQVKEDFISRIRELGVHVSDGKITFRTSLLNTREFLCHEGIFEYYGTDGEKKQIPLKAGQMGFTFCQVPVIYTVSGKERTVLTFSDGRKISRAGNIIDKEISAKIFSRTGDVVKAEVFVRENIAE